MKIPENIVAIRNTAKITYPKNPPFNPPTAYPELDITETDPDNQVYPFIRQLLCDMGFDRERFGTPSWNPLGEIIKPGMNVFIKPNTVVHAHSKGGELFSIIVHPSVIRPILDYVCKALDNKGKITVGESLLYSSDYEKMLQASQMDKLLKWYKQHTSVDLQWFDLRLNKAKRTWLYGRWARKKVECDPEGYQLIDLGDLSLFKGIDPSKLRIAIASYKNMYKHHSNGKHEYLFPRSFLQSDIVINIPKLKTHRRTAITLALKNYMGIPSLKDSLPHFMVGSPKEGGDQYINPSRRKKIITRLHDIIQTHPSIFIKFICAIIKKLLWNSHYLIPFKDNVYEGMWWGNDTLWRTLGDLNRIVMYADKKGRIQNTPQRKQFILVDGIIGGEGDGPLSCEAVKAGVLICGTSPAIVDAIAATEMGFDIYKIPLIYKSFDFTNHPLPLNDKKISDIRVYVDGKEVTFDQFLAMPHKNFKPHPMWDGHL